MDRTKETKVLSQKLVNILSRTIFSVKLLVLKSFNIPTYLILSMFSKKEVGILEKNGAEVNLQEKDMQTIIYTACHYKITTSSKIEEKKKRIMEHRESINPSGVVRFRNGWKRNGY